MISAIVSELARRTANAPIAAQQEETSQSMQATNPEEAREPIVQLFEEALARQQEKFAGQIHTETDERSVRLNALIIATVELYRTHVPGMEAGLADSSNRENVVRNLTVEYMPLLMLPPDELPRAFAEYILWTWGNGQATEQIVDIDYLKGVFRKGLSLLPTEARQRTVKGKHRFEWGKLV